VPRPRHSDIRFANPRYWWVRVMETEGGRINVDEGAGLESLDELLREIGQAPGS